MKKRLQSLGQSQSNSSTDSSPLKIDINVRTKRRGTFFPAALERDIAQKQKQKAPLEFNDASQLPEVGLDEDESDKKANTIKVATVAISAKKRRASSSTAVKQPSKIVTPLPVTVPLPTSETSSTAETPKKQAVDEVERADELLKKFDGIQDRIRKNLQNIRNQEQIRFNIKQPQIRKSNGSCECSASASDFVQKIMNEVALNRILHPEAAMGNVRQIRTEIGQYKCVLKYGGDVNEAVELSETSRSCCPSTWMKPTKETKTKETGVQYEGK